MAEAKYTAKLNALKEELTAKIPDGISPEEALALIARDDLDDSLVLFTMLSQGTPAALAPFESDVDELMANLPLLKQMMLADGPRDNQYGQAMQIYKQIQEQRTCKEHTVLDNLAIATALIHAAPLLENDTGYCGAQPGATPVDPVARYLNYEMAFLNGELDDDFHLLDTYSLRYVVDGDEPDATAAWARKALKNFRPDHLFAAPKARYVNWVRSEVQYSQDKLGNDKPTLQYYQNILMNGGICGRRAWSARFVLRAFGMPQAARPSPGHASIMNWTRQEGWVINLGPGWGSGTTKTKYWKDTDFRDTAIARTDPQGKYWQVQRARWIGDLKDEPVKVFGPGEAERYKNGPKFVGLWYNAALQAQKAILEGLPPPSDTCPASPVTTVTQRLLAEKMPEHQAKEIVYHDDGSITIPAAAFVSNETKDVVSMLSFHDGGLQIYCPFFVPQGLTLLRGGSWKGAGFLESGERAKSNGMGKYNNWGFRVALSAGDDAAPTKVIDLPGNIKLEMIFIKPGKFVMGGENSEDRKFTGVSVPKHEVEITQGYYIGKYPVTQAQFQAMTGKNPAKSTREPNCPVDNVSEQQCLDFCNAFSENAGGMIRLPTEAEWEFACRAGSVTKYFFGDEKEPAVGEYAWYGGNSGGKSHPVGQKKPNPWGLHDILGSVFERCSDRYKEDYYANSPKKDPQGPSVGTKAELEYRVNVANKAGKYTLTVNVVTINEQQRLMVAVDDDEILMTLPWTMGDWGEKTVEVDLEEGENEIRFWRDRPPQYGISIKSFVLKPVGIGQATS